MQKLSAFLGYAFLIVLVLAVICGLSLFGKDDLLGFSLWMIVPALLLILISRINLRLRRIQPPFKTSAYVFTLFSSLLLLSVLALEAAFAWRGGSLDLMGATVFAAAVVFPLLGITVISGVVANR